MSHSRSLPSELQLAWQRDRSFALFFHFGINTFNNLEWSDGTLDPMTFAPTALDCDQWAQVARDCGASHVILTAKHHDGFCLWPTLTTEYSVKSSPWKQGKGDVVGDLAAACRKYGLGLGLYLSPWDRHDPDWSGNPTVYDSRYVEQLTELCTRYGPLVEVWFDGAGSAEHPYDWRAIVDVVHKHQPDALIFNMGDPTIRWVGNEDGLASDPCLYAVDRLEGSMFDDDGFLPHGAIYCPPECDVSIRTGWFWHPDALPTLKSRQHLEAIWYRSIGLGANLLLNVPPNRDGLLDSADVERLVEFTSSIRNRFAHPINADIAHDGNRVVATFPEPVRADHVILRERLDEGQRVTNHRVRNVATGAVIAEGHSIGIRRVHAFPAIDLTAIDIEVEGEAPVVTSVEAYLTGSESIPTLPI